MEQVFKDPVTLTKGINLKELMTSFTEFHIDTDFKKRSAGPLNADDLFTDIGDEEGSDSDDALKNIERSTDAMMLSSPEYNSFDKLAAQMVDCVPSGDIKMLIIEEGAGPLVPADSEVMLHYAAYWERETIPFDSSLTMNMGAPTRIQLGSGTVLPGLEVGITMVHGPTARFHLLLQPNVAWGPRGVLPRIKPEPALFVIVLYAVRDVQAAARFNDLPSEEQSKFEVTIRTVTSLHTQGKEHFNKKKFKKSLQNYQQSILVLNLSRTENESEANQVKNLKVRAFLNIVMCYYKLNKPKHILRSLESLDYVIEVEKNCKALFYYGRAYELLNKTEDAINYYQKALKLEPKNKDIGKALNNIDDYLKKSEKNEKEMWQSVFKTEKKEVFEVDEDFQNGVREMFNELASSEEYAKFDLPTGLPDNEVAFIKSLAKDIKGLIVVEDGMGKKKKVTIIRKFT